MRIITGYSPSHKPFYDQFFHPSLGRWMPDVPLTVHEWPQKSQGGQYGSDGWGEATTFKNEAWAIEAMGCDRWLWSDADVMFCADIREHLIGLAEEKKVDLLFQAEHSRVNSGFFYVHRNTPQIRCLFSDMLAEAGNWKHDQMQIWQFIKDRGIAFEHLDGRFWHNGMVTHVWWEDGAELHLPDHVQIVHACYCEGIANKSALLAKAERILWQRNCLEMD